MAPVTNLGVLAFASAVLAIPHAHDHRRLHARGEPPVYGASSAPVGAVGTGSGSWSGYPSGTAYGTGYGTGWAQPTGNSPSGYPSGQAPPYPSVSKAPVGPASGYPSGSSISICTETSTLIYRTSTEYSTYYVTHTLYPSGSPAGAAPAESGSPAGAYGSAPANANEACTPDVTVTVTAQQTVTVTAGGEGSVPSAPEKNHPHGHGHKSGGFPSKAPPSPPAESSPASPEGSSPPAYSAPAAPSSAPSSTPSSAPSSGSGSGSGSGAGGAAFSGGKIGLAYNDASLCEPFVGKPGVGFAYNWGSSSAGLDPKIPFVPMLWGSGSDFTDSWMENAKSAIAGGAPYLFSFNEADMPSQANLSPTEAASLWKQYMEPFAGQATLVAPSVTSSQSPGQGLDWLKSFLAACSDCTIGAVNQHWYNSDGNDIDLFKQQVSAAASTSGKPVFVSEFGFIGSDSDISSAISSVTSWMNSNDQVLGYNYFMVSDGLLLNGNSLSSYGETYANAG